MSGRNDKIIRDVARGMKKPLKQMKREWKTLTPAQKARVRRRLDEMWKKVADEIVARLDLDTEMTYEEAKELAKAHKHAGRSPRAI